MLKLLFKQPLNYWQSMSVMYRIQTFLIIGLVFTYFTTRLINIIGNSITAYGVSYAAITSLLVIFVVSIVALSTPFILIYLIPRQNSLKIFRDKPLNKIQSIKLLYFYNLKYQIILIVTITILSLSFLILDLFWGAVLLFLSILFLLITPLQNILYLAFIQKRSAYLYSHFTGLILFLSLFTVSYLWYSFNWSFIIISIVIMCLGSIFFYLKIEIRDLEFIFRFQKVQDDRKNWQRTWLKNIPKFLSSKTQVLFNKELISSWRNPRFLRLKIITLLIQIILSIIIINYDPENSVLYLSLLTSVLIWFHYGSYFSDKFAQADTRWFINILPLKFFRFFIAKFIAEFTYIVLILAALVPFLFFTGIDVLDILQITLILLVFSIGVLITMINFQMMFYENPRYAGYAYHFSVIFFVIMVYNYRFVGPLMALFMILYSFYKNYRYFKV